MHDSLTCSLKIHLWQMLPMGSWVRRWYVGRSQGSRKWGSTHLAAARVPTPRQRLGSPHHKPSRRCGWNDELSKDFGAGNAQTSLNLLSRYCM